MPTLFHGTVCAFVQDEQSGHDTIQEGMVVARVLSINLFHKLFSEMFLIIAFSFYLL